MHISYMHGTDVGKCLRHAFSPVSYDHILLHTTPSAFSRLSVNSEVRAQAAFGL